MAVDKGDLASNFNEQAKAPLPEVKNDFRKSQLKGVAKEDFNKAAEPPPPPPPPKGPELNFNPPGMPPPKPTPPPTKAEPNVDSNHLPSMNATPTMREEFNQKAKDDRVEALRVPTPGEQQRAVVKAGPITQDQVQAESKLTQVKNLKKDRDSEAKEAAKTAFKERLQQAEKKKKERDREHNRDRENRDR